MKIMLSALETAPESCKEEGYKTIAELLIKNGVKLKWNLMSYYYIKLKGFTIADYIRDHSELIMIDSGAHSFQFGKKVNWVEYTKEYADWIAKFDRPNVIGYFEMDIDNIIGYDKVLELRRIIEKRTDKVIPVWHPNRGIRDYELMCQQYAGKIIAIGGFQGTDINDEQYLSFVKVARKYGCKVHCLGMTRSAVLDKVPFDFTDSSSWSAQARFGGIGYGRFKVGKVSRDFSKHRRGVVFVESYKQGVKMQEHYYKKWKKECKD